MDISYGLPKHKVDEQNPLVCFTDIEWDLINIALLKIQDIRNIPNSPFKKAWDDLYKLSKNKGLS